MRLLCDCCATAVRIHCEHCAATPSAIGLGRIARRAPPRSAAGASRSSGRATHCFRRKNIGTCVPRLCACCRPRWRPRARTSPTPGPSRAEPERARVDVDRTRPLPLEAAPTTNRPRATPTRHSAEAGRVRPLSTVPARAPPGPELSRARASPSGRRLKQPPASEPIHPSEILAQL